MTDYVGEEILADWLEARRQADTFDPFDVFDGEGDGFTLPIGNPLEWANPSPDTGDAPLPF